MAGLAPKPASVVRGGSPATGTAARWRSTRERCGSARSSTWPKLRPAAVAGATVPFQRLCKCRVARKEDHRSIARRGRGARAASLARWDDGRRLVDDLARQAGVAVHAVRLFADLQRSRERLVRPARRSGGGSGEICTMDLRRSLRP